MSDEELDNIFRKAAGDPGQFNDLADWNNMELQLDQEDRKGWWNHKKIIFGIIGLLLIVPATFWYSSITHGSTAAIESNKLTSQDQNLSNHVDNTQTKSNVDDSSTHNEYKTAPDETKAQGTGELSGEAPQIESPAGSSKLSGAKSITKNKIRNESNTVLRMIPEDSEGRSDLTSPPAKALLTDNSLEREGERMGLVMNNPTTLLPQNNNALVLTPNPFPVFVDSVYLVLSADSILSVRASLADPNSKTIRAHSGISLKVTVAPDFSSAEFFKQESPGINYGIMAGYVLNEKWSVYTGTILANKIYSSNTIGDSYQAPNGYNYPISQIDGKCKMLDIPLNVYYSFGTGKSLSFKVGMGLTSYVMLKEDYIYYLDKPYGKNEYYQTVESGNVEWFKMMNLSAILQKRISNSVFIEIEPFIKVPLAGIGAGGISLYSIGSFVSIRYDF